MQFATRSEWIGLLIGKAGARIRNVQQVTGCTVTIIDSHDIAHGRNGGGRSTDRVSQRDLANHRWGDDGRSERRGGKAGASAMSCRIAISGSDADSVRQAREDMDFVEARIAVGATQVNMIEVMKLFMPNRTSQKAVGHRQPCALRLASKDAVRSPRPGTSVV